LFIDERLSEEIIGVEPIIGDFVPFLSTFFLLLLLDVDDFILVILVIEDDPDAIDDEDKTESSELRTRILPTILFRLGDTATFDILISFGLLLLLDVAMLDMVDLLLLFDVFIFR